MIVFYNVSFLFSILIRYFHPDKGVKKNIFELNELSIETALLLTD